MKKKLLDIPKSGRCGNVVLFVIRNRQRERAYVIPRIVRNAATGRARTIFGALSQAYHTLLTDEQQAAWIAAAAKVRSRPRLGQCGPLTGQQHFVGINSARGRVGRQWLLWPPRPVAFAPNPVETLSLRYVEGHLRIELRLSRPVAEDVMVFAQAPCRPGWKKWRHGTCLGLLPAPQDGISDITEMYLAAFGEPEPGRKVIIRTRQQRDGWEDKANDVSALIPVNPLAAQSRTAVLPVHALLSQPCPTMTQSPPGHSPPARRPAGRHPFRPAIPQPCKRDHHATATGASPLLHRPGAGRARCFRRVTPLWSLRALPKTRWTGHWRELWHGS